MNTCICFDICHMTRYKVYSELLSISRPNISGKNCNGKSMCNYVSFDACLRTVQSGHFYFNMAEHTEKSLLLQGDSLPDKSSGGATRSSSDWDLHDTFSLSKLYMDGKIDNLETKLVREQNTMSNKIKEEVSIKFKHEGNRIQFKFNEETVNELNKLYKLIPSTEAQSIRVVLDLLDKVKGCNKLIRIADSSPAGWSTVREYESNDIASDSEDEKKIRQAKRRAMRTMKDKTKGRPAPYSNKPRLPPAETYANPANNQQFQRQPFRNSVARREPCQLDMCFFCKQFGHLRKNCPLKSGSVGIGSSGVANQKKVNFSPVQSLEWLGIVWNASEFSLVIPDRRVDDLRVSLVSVIGRFPKITARTLAQVVGRIISMALVIGNVARIMTKFCYMAIECRTEWDKWLLFPCPYKVLSELHFWLDNITSLNIKLLGHYSKSHVVIYSDASGIGAGAYLVELDKKIFHETWDFSEAQESST
ncbi:unnamed protein product [Mytilus coruscus]|uniref:CCHC-type domain-containing protein n=1 Tax=Mytilus coruscus TaxID=42192 RepID=A0A6J8DBH0_MYTCO|nr:unnamed protein product [Mytilus coruscus]